jgi:hypothetical protein
MSIFACKLVLVTIESRLQRNLETAEFWRREYLAYEEEHFGRYGC